MKTFDQLVTKVEEGWWDQQKAKVAGLGSSIAGDKAGAAKKQAQSLAMGSKAFALFDQFKQDMLELTKSTDQLQFNKNFPDFKLGYSVDHFKDFKFPLAKTSIYTLHSLKNDLYKKYISTSIESDLSLDSKHIRSVMD